MPVHATTPTFISQNPLPPFGESFFLLDHAADSDDVTRHSFLQNALRRGEIQTPDLRREL